MLKLRENVAQSPSQDTQRRATLVTEALKAHERCGVPLPADCHKPSYCGTVLMADPAFIHATGMGYQDCANALWSLLDLGMLVERPEGLRQTADVQQWPDSMGFPDLDAARRRARRVNVDGGAS